VFIGFYMHLNTTALLVFTNHKIMYGPWLHNLFFTCMFTFFTFFAHRQMFSRNYLFYILKFFSLLFSKLKTCLMQKMWQDRLSVLLRLLNKILFYIFQDSFKYVFINLLFIFFAYLWSKCYIIVYRVGWNQK